MMSRHHILGINLFINFMEVVPEGIHGLFAEDVLGKSFLAEVLEQGPALKVPQRHDKHHTVKHNPTPSLVFVFLLLHTHSSRQSIGNKEVRQIPRNSSRGHHI